MDDGLRGRHQDEKEDHDRHQGDCQDVGGAPGLVHPPQVLPASVGAVDLSAQAEVEVDKEQERHVVAHYRPGYPVRNFCNMAAVEGHPPVPVEIPRRLRCPYRRRQGRRRGKSWRKTRGMC
ncbi:FMRFamide receptor [Biomphalaria glabrata]|nr:FMRFamide receptor [Biomphalaria glabrata]